MKLWIPSVVLSLLWSVFAFQISKVYRANVHSLQRSHKKVIGYFFGCFHVRDDLLPRINPVSRPTTAITEEPADSLASNCLWSVLVPNAEEGDHLQWKDERDDVTGSRLLDDGLRAQAKFLKACGTLPQTPAEIRYTTKLKELQPHNGDADSRFHSWLPNTAIGKALGKQPDQLQSPIKISEAWENGSESSSQSSNSCITGKNTASTSTTSSEGCEVGHTVKDIQAQNSSTASTPMVASTQYKNKSVRFEGQSGACSSSSRSASPKIANQNLKPATSPSDHSVLNPSPYPTPLKLTDDMQTPGTVFPSYVYKKEIGKNSRIRLQYVYSGIIPKNFSQKNVAIEELGYNNCSAPLEEHIDNDTPQSQVKVQASASEKELDVAPTFSSWIPLNSNQKGINDQLLIPMSQGLPEPGRTPGDRPILGMVAAHWINDENSSTPRRWDGNGIPNTTNKYKEDQKVSWHATPFEERLEKALTEDEFIKEKKQP